MTSRTNGTLQHTIVDAPGGRYAPLQGTTPTPRDGEISCRGQNRGDLPRAVVLEKLALQVEKALPSNGSMLGDGTAQKTQESSEPNPAYDCTGGRRCAPDIATKRQRVECRVHPAGAGTARDRARALTAHDLSHLAASGKGGHLTELTPCLCPSLRGSPPWAMTCVGQSRGCILVIKNLKSRRALS